MTYESKILFGRITRTHGFEGTVIIRPEKDPGDYLLEKESVFIEIDGILVPFFISDTEVTPDGSVRMRFEGYESSKRVAEFVGCRIFKTGGEVPEDAGDEIRNLVGFRVSIRGKRIIGTIKSIIHNPGQDLIILESAGGKEILIPLHSDLIYGYNEKEKTLRMDIPEGLESLNE